MPDFRVFETDHYAGRLKKVFSSRLPQVLAKLHVQVYPQLKQQPYFGPHIKKLKDIAPETWRYRIGDYRFFYEIDAAERIVFMTDVAHRSHAYD